MPTKHSKKHVSEVDPIVVKVQETLEENLTFFIDNIAGLVRRYDGLLGRALQLNQGTASEIAQLQTFMNEAMDSTTSDSLTKNDDAAPAAKSTSETATKKDEDKKDASTTDAAPIVKQMQNNMPTSPLLKRAASPVTAKTTAGDAFPSIDENSKKVEQDAGATAGAGAGVATNKTAKKTTDEKEKSSKKKIRIVEVKFPDNTEIVKQLRLLKRESYELGATMDGIHDWIALNVPDMKDDENDGVEVMGAVIEQVSSLTDTVRSVYGAESKYLEERAELEKSMLKLPESETMKLAMKSHDADTWDEVDRGWRTLIRVCLLLYSILSKNMAMLKEPRKKSNTSSAMFM